MTEDQDIERERAPKTKGARAVKLLEKLELDPVTQEPRPRRHAISLANDAVAADQAAAPTDGSQLAAGIVELEDSAGSPIDRGKLTREQKQAISDASLRAPKPPWLKIKMPGGGRFAETAQTVRENNLHTICEEGNCPNMGECWGRGTATFQILDTCTRACRYCNVKTGIPGTEPDPLEPGKLANAVHKMAIAHAVVTSVDRDELPDRGATQFAKTINAIRRRSPETSIEVLVPDFMGLEEEGMRIVMEAGPDVYAHNTETVPRLYRRIRPKGDYQRAMWVLQRAKVMSREMGYGESVLTKTGLIAGMGETIGELKEVLHDLREHGVDVVTIGQYLRPSAKHLPVDRYVTPEEFDDLAEYGMSLGFGSVFAGPLVRSSYKAEEQRRAAVDPSLGKMLSDPPRVTEADLASVGEVPEWKREDAPTSSPTV
ncbi:MAG: lipoyl synthase [Gaiellales bacterium]